MTITEILVAEHSVFLNLFDQIERALPDLKTPAAVRTMASLVEGLLKSHADAEANMAYLALDHVLAHQGKVDRMHQDHHEIDDRLLKVQAAKTCAEAGRLMREAMAASRAHFASEERSVFPLLEKILKPETLVALGKARMARAGRERAPGAQPAAAREQVASATRVPRSSALG